jgi:hypothetical protein
VITGRDRLGVLVVGWGNDDSDALSVAKNCWEPYRALIPVTKKIRKPNYITSLEVIRIRENKYHRHYW